jgi:hypothetical protein
MCKCKCGDSTALSSFQIKKRRQIYCHLSWAQPFTDEWVVATGIPFLYQKAFQFREARMSPAIWGLPTNKVIMSNSFGLFWDKIESAPQPLLWPGEPCPREFHWILPQVGTKHPAAAWRSAVFPGPEGGAGIGFRTRQDLDLIFELQSKRLLMRLVFSYRCLILF